MTRRTIESEITIGSYGDVEIDGVPDHIHHLSGTVTIEVGGAVPNDGADATRLAAALTDAVTETIEDFEATGEPIDDD